MKIGRTNGRKGGRKEGGKDERKDGRKERRLPVVLNVAVIVGDGHLGRSCKGLKGIRKRNKNKGIRTRE